MFLSSCLPVLGEEEADQFGALDRQVIPCTPRGAVKGEPDVYQGVPKGMVQGAAPSGQPPCVAALEAQNIGEILDAEPSPLT